MKDKRKTWMPWSAGFLVVLVLPLLLMAFWPQPKGTPKPPPGPHQAGEVWLADLGGKATMEMVWCPPGKFLMGSPATEMDRVEDEVLQHEVTLTQGFWLGKYEVTQRQWQAIMGDNPSWFHPKEIVRWQFWKWQVPVWRKDFLVNRWSLPVECVSWDDCQEFCQKAGPGFRLPTVAEWEYACRAGSTGPYGGTGVLDEMGWYRDNSGGKPHPIGRKRPNAWGLHDMHGNVWEWCQDWDGDYPTGAETDPTGPATGAARVRRGGGWSDYDLFCRAAFQFSFLPDRKCGFQGFRVVLAPAAR
jgi:formylglycine-generating enzyme required for sulfatase activity